MNISTPLPLLVFLLVIPIIFYPKWLDWIKKNHSPKNIFSTNQWLALILRLSSIFCLVLALAHLHRSVSSNTRSIALLIDHSDSIPLSTRQFAYQHAQNIMQQLTDQDNSQIIFFGQHPTLVSSLSTATGNFINSAATDISAAIETAITTFPSTQDKRLVIFTDGQQTQGKLTDALDQLVANQIQTFVVKLPINHPLEVIAHHLQVPEKVQPSEEFWLRAILESQTKTTALIEIWQTHRSTRITVIQKQQIKLLGGKQVFQFRHRLDEFGDYQFQLRLKIDDQFQENNQVFATTTVVTEHPKVLYVVNSLEKNGNGSLWPTLVQATNLKPKQIESYQFPKTLAGLQSYQTIILDNLPIEVFSSAQLKILQNYVGQVGGGLIVIGGNQSYGPGGYHQTELETILPVKMQPKQGKQSLALVMLIDVSGSMANRIGKRQKIDLALEGVRLAITTLDKSDMISVIGFAERVLHDIPFSTDHTFIIGQLNRFQPSGGTLMRPALETAIQRLNTAKASQKHLLILSDGKSQGEFTSILSEIFDSEISVSTIAVGNTAEEFLQKLAIIGRGSYRHVKNITQLPQILVDQVRRSRKYVVKQTIEPVISSNSPVLNQIIHLPELDGYVATTEKKDAQILITSGKKNPDGVDQPILAIWRYGLGQAVALTTDAGQQWSTKWQTSTQKFFSWYRLWVQLIMAVRKSEDSDKFELQTQLTRGLNGIEGHVRLAGEIATDISATAVTPTGQLLPIDFQLTATDQAEGKFPLTEVGIYTISVQVGRQQKTANLVVSYPLEYQHLGQNLQILSQICQQTNGILDPLIDQIIAPAKKNTIYQYPLTQPLLFISLIILILELIFRIWSPVQRQKKLKVKETNIPTNIKNDYQVPIIDSTTDYSSSLNQMLLAKQRANRSHSDES